MATARSLVFTAAGKSQETKDADTQLVSGTVANGSGTLTISAAATSLALKVGGTTYLTVSSAAITASGGAVFTGDGSGLTNISNSSLNSGIDAAKIGGGLVSNTEFNYLDGVTSPIQTQIDGLGTIVNLLVNDGYTLFLNRTASDISTYETLRSEPATGLEKIDTVTVTSGGGLVLLGAYATDPGVPGVSTLPSGMWGFREFASVSNTGGTSTIVARVYSRNTLGTETLLFESTSPTITTTSAALYYWIYTQTVDVALDPTDRIVVKFYGQTTSVSSRNISHYYEGSTHASWMSTPMPAPIPVSGTQAQVVATPAAATGPVALRSLTTAYLPTTGVSSGSYPTSGQIPTFTVNANGLLTAAGSTTTLTSPAISNPTISGTLQSASGSLTVNAAATSTIVQVAGSPVLTVAPGGSTLTSSLTCSSITSAAATDMAVNAVSGQVVSLRVNSVAVLTVSGSGLTAAQPLAMGSNKITGLSQGTASNEALCYPWVGNASGFSALGSTYTISADNGLYEDTGLSVALPSAGTYLVGYTARTNINAASGGSGSYILTELYNSSDSSVIANTEEIGAYATTITASYYGVSTVIIPVTVAAGKTIKLLAKAVAPTSTTTRTVNSDANGRTTLWYVKIA